MGILKRASEISYIHHLKSSAVHADVLIDFNFDDIGTFSAESNEELYNAGRHAGADAVSQIRDMLQE